MAGDKPSKLGLFIAGYAAANAGATIAFVPLLVLILPLKSAQIAGEDKLLLLSVCLLAGALTASLSNITAGWVSDRQFAQKESRIAQITISLCALLVSYYVFAKAGTWSSLVLAIVFFQISLNFLYSPLGALIADKIPHEAKGRTAALLNMGLPIGTFAIAVLTQSLFETNEQRLIAIAVIVAVLIAPLLFLAAKQPNLPHSQPELEVETINDKMRQNVQLYDIICAWIARFCIQMSGAVIFGYFFYYLQDVVDFSNDFTELTAEQAMGTMAAIAAPAAILAAGFAGCFSDRLRLRKVFLLGAASAVVVALASMLLWPVWGVVFAAYIVFIAGFTAFLAVDTAIVTQLLTGSGSRARTLGIMNLTNTLPSVLAPGLAIMMSSNELSQSVLTPLMQICSVLAGVAIISVSRIRSIA